ncbi:hypothetical protein Riv7116_1085 [Rivularia sp. PCC 7116]|uniref:hypothetical protein n=1 Tax=Rivularia sp. PCC 7116 TaxID=373994 RepID=UPI00029EE1A8|nr:hypothetical protein [Rivularia sp. PCC 7116]AFY53659.1 hypothetical protein Riv7116_1085 [Rivularia sp. PCC 7116]
MQYRTTAGWSLITSGLTTLLLKVLPGNSLWWGISFLVIGVIILFIRKSDLAES